MATNVFIAVVAMTIFIGIQCSVTAATTTIEELEIRVRKLETSEFPIGSILLLPYSDFVPCPPQYNDMYRLATNVTRYLMIGQSPTLDDRNHFPSELILPLKHDCELSNSITVDTRGFERACRPISQNQRPSASLSTGEFTEFLRTSLSSLSLYVKVCIKINA
jgi:hypothetical protein